MNISLTTNQLSGLAYGTAKRNAANPAAAPMTDAEFASDILGVQCDKFAAEKEEAALESMAANEELMRIGLKAMDATPEKRAAMIAAADQALAAPPSPFK